MLSAIVPPSLRGKGDRGLGPSPHSPVTVRKEGSPMAVLTRRNFVRSSLTVVSVGAFMPTIFTRAIAAAASDKSPSSAGSSPSKTLIIIQLAGGNDGLNTVIPYADPLYH